MHACIPILHAAFSRLLHTPSVLCMQTGLGTRFETESSPPSTPWVESAKLRTPKKAKRMRDDEVDEEDEELNDEEVGSAKQRRTRKKSMRLLIDKEDEGEEGGEEDEVR